MANSGREANRILMLQAKQEEKKKQDEEARKKVHEENTVRIGSIDSQFEAKSTNADDILVQNTVGLVSLADYRKTKSLIEANIAETELQEESRKRGADEGGKKKSPHRRPHLGQKKSPNSRLPRLCSESPHEARPHLTLLGQIIEVSTCRRAKSECFFQVYKYGDKIIGLPLL